MDDRRFHEIVGPRSDDMSRFLLGVEFADGRKATNIAFPHHTGDDDPGPVLMGGGGGGGGGRFDFTFWVWPLPPAGSFAFVCRWEAEGVEQTRVDVDTGPILDASSRSEQLWPDQGESSGGLTSRRQTSRISMRRARSSGRHTDDGGL